MALVTEVGEVCLAASVGAVVRLEAEVETAGADAPARERSRLQRAVPRSWSRGHRGCYPPPCVDALVSPGSP